MSLRDVNERVQTQKTIGLGLPFLPAEIAVVIGQILIALSV